VSVIENFLRLWLYNCAVTTDKKYLVKDFLLRRELMIFPSSATVVLCADGAGDLDLSNRTIVNCFATKW
jgi:hypothetical protein